MLPGINSGGGSVSNESAAASGDAKGQSGTGNKTFTFGGNPNLSTTTATLANPFVIAGLVFALWLYTKNRK